MQLEDNIFIKVVSLVKKGKIYTRRKDYEKGLSFYKEAKSFFSMPVEEHSGVEELYILLGDTYFEMKNFDKSREYYIKSQECIDKEQLEISNFKIGKTYYEQGNIETAKKYFEEIYTVSGKKHFYDEDAKYYYLVMAESKSNQEKNKKTEAYKTYKGKNYTEEEWKILEQKLYDEFLKKGHV